MLDARWRAACTCLRRILGRKLTRTSALISCACTCVRLLKHEHSFAAVGGGGMNTAKGMYDLQGLGLCSYRGRVVMGGRSECSMPVGRGCKLTRMSALIFEHSLSTICGGGANVADGEYDIRIIVGCFVEVSRWVGHWRSECFVPVGAPAHARACLRRIQGGKLTRMSALIFALAPAFGISNVNTDPRRLAAATSMPRRERTIHKGFYCMLFVEIS